MLRARIEATGPARTYVGFLSCWHLIVRLLLTMQGSRKDVNTLGLEKGQSYETLRTLYRHGRVGDAVHRCNGADAAGASRASPRRWRDAVPDTRSADCELTSTICTRTIAFCQP